MGEIDGNRTTYRRSSEILEEGADAQRGREGGLSDSLLPGVFCSIDGMKALRFLRTAEYAAADPERCG
jgi:hypothetical protein